MELIESIQANINKALQGPELEAAVTKAEQKQKQWNKLLKRYNKLYKSLREHKQFSLKKAYENAVTSKNLTDKQMDQLKVALVKAEEKQKEWETLVPLFEEKYKIFQQLKEQGNESDKTRISIIEQKFKDIQFDANGKYESGPISKTTYDSITLKPKSTTTKKEKGEKHPCKTCKGEIDSRYEPDCPYCNTCYLKRVEEHVKEFRKLEHQLHEKWGAKKYDSEYAYTYGDWPEAYEKFLNKKSSKNYLKFREQFNKAEKHMKEIGNTTLKKKTKEPTPDEEESDPIILDEEDEEEEEEEEDDDESSELGSEYDKDEPVRPLNYYKNLKKRERDEPNELEPVVEKLLELASNEQLNAEQASELLEQFKKQRKLNCSEIEDHLTKKYKAFIFNKKTGQEFTMANLSVHLCQEAAQMEAETLIAESGAGELFRFEIREYKKK